MEIRRVKLDKSFQLNARARNKSYIEKATEKLISYYADKEKKIRVNSVHLCKYCYYYGNERFGGCAITTTSCTNCEQEMVFNNTCVDILCSDCAKELKTCKHCGQKID